MSGWQERCSVCQLIEELTDESPQVKVFILVSSKEQSSRRTPVV